MLLILPFSKEAEEVYILFSTSSALAINGSRNARRLLEDASSFLAKYAGGVRCVL